MGAIFVGSCREMQSRLPVRLIGVELIPPLCRGARFVVWSAQNFQGALLAIASFTDNPDRLLGLPRGIPSHREDPLPGLRKARLSLLVPGPEEGFHVAL